MDRDVMMREAFGVREACFRFAMKPLKLSDEPYVSRASSSPKNEMLPAWAQHLIFERVLTSTLVHLVYYLMRALVLGRPAGAIEWDTRHRLMVNSFLEDGAFARLIYKNRFDCFCARIEACLDAAVGAGDAVETPLSQGNHARFAHHVGAWLALVHLPSKPAIDYKASREELLRQAVWFALRGMGITDKAIATYYNPKALAFSFNEI